MANDIETEAIEKAWARKEQRRIGREALKNLVEKHGGETVSRNLVLVPDHTVVWVRRVVMSGPEAGTVECAGAIALSAVRCLVKRCDEMLAAERGRCSKCERPLRKGGACGACDEVPSECLCAPFVGGA